MLFENQYRTNTCGELRQNNIGSSVRVCGWVQTIRDHGGVLFVDIRDQYGVVQTVFHNETLLKGVTKESVVSIGGTVVQRAPETVNPKIPTGYVEVAAESLTVLSRAIAGLPFEIDQSKETKEELRLSYRFLDLRNPKVHQNIVLRSQIVAYLRQKMTNLGFWRFKRRSCPRPHRKAHGIIWCQAGSIPASFMHCRRLLRFLNSF